VRVALALLLTCGVRASEALGFVFDDVDFERGTAQVRFQMGRDGRRARIKTDRRSARARRAVPVVPSPLAQLREWRLMSRWSADSDLILTNSRGRTMGYWALRDELADVFEAAGIANASPHTLRHTYASRLIADGRSLEFVADQMGISSTTAHTVYIHSYRARQEAEASRDALEAVYGAMIQGR